MGQHAKSVPGADATSGAAPSTGARVRHWFVEVLLTLLALFGLVCILATAAAWFLGINIMMFKTGSMSPEIPAGSVALVKRIPAAEAAIGDVITVDREAGLPITHRVIRNDPDPENRPDGRIIEMRGDANASPDPLPYKVTEVREVIWSRPGWGNAVAMLGQPWVLGIVVLVSAGVVTWAFWPRDGGRDGGRGGGRDARSREAGKPESDASGTSGAAGAAPRG